MRTTSVPTDPENGNLETTVQSDRPQGIEPQPSMQLIAMGVLRICISLTLLYTIHCSSLHAFSLPTSQCCGLEIGLGTRRIEKCRYLGHHVTAFSSVSCTNIQETVSHPYLYTKNPEKNRRGLELAPFYCSTIFFLQITYLC